MIVCHCYCVRDRDVRRLVQGGGASPGDVARETGAGTACGGCRPALREVVREERERETDETADVTDVRAVAAS